MMEYIINDIRQSSPVSLKLDEFCSLVSLTNIIKSDTCFTKFFSSPIDLFLNKQTKIQTLLNLDLAIILSSYILFLNLISKGLNLRLFTIETTTNLMKLIF